jgi:glycosyltransferase involved in cell wall biosynthesis
MGKTKVLRIIARLNIGGPAIHVVNLTAGLDPARFEQVLVVGTESPTEGSMLDHALSHGVQPVQIPEMVTDFSLKPRDLTALNKLYRLMRQEQPLIVHTHTAKAGLLGRVAARLARVPIVIHTYHGHVLQGYYSPLKNTLVRRMEQSLALLSNRLVAVSEQVKEDLVHYGVAPAAKIEVIPLGFNLAPFLEARTQRGQLRQEYALDRRARLIGIVGRLFPIKNHRLFLDAAARVAAQEPAARFLVVGDGELRSALEQQAQALGIADRVLFTGWRRDLPRIYADLDVLVVSSDNEGTPVSAIEAMAAGCPVVATRVGGLPDFITDGDTGVLVPPRDLNKLATAIVYLLDNPQTAGRIAQTAQPMVRERFTVQRLLANVDQLYSQLLMQRGLANPSLLE